MCFTVLHSSYDLKNEKTKHNKKKNHNEDLQRKCATESGNHMFDQNTNI